ncbi:MULTISPECIES: P-type conjugative transfer protein TrbJ [Rhodomicrobium]|uniref:P-type conjugative transfer protein TrbJ n=1 Tax=Rhodomicrobium TaxID=1068 RepID=UPI000B4B7C09|nr:MULTISPECIES: P-type conjugative transfer protein TrbJ [Rhodomicrobium]
MARHFVHRVFFAFVLASAFLGCFHKNANADIVYDPWNYKQNYIATLRALQQINNQVKAIQNQIDMLKRMDQNLASSGQTIAPQLQQQLSQITGALHSGSAIALKLQDTETSFAKLYPTEFADLSAETSIQQTKARWSETLESVKRSGLLEAATADGLAADTETLTALLARSRAAPGALEAAQAGNELQGLTLKQQLQLQALLAAQSRGETADRARRLAAEEEARVRLRSFLGSGSAYAAHP